QSANLLGRGMLLAAESMKRMPSPEAGQILNYGLSLLPRPIASMTHPMGFAMALSPDGHYVVTGGQDRIGRVWDLTSRQESTPKIHHQGAVWAVAYSPDGRYIATASEDRTARVVDATSGQEVFPVNHDDAVLAVAFSQDSQYLATGGLDKTV